MGFQDDGVLLKTKTMTRAQYSTSYLYLALRLGCPLATTDRKVQDAVCQVGAAVLEQDFPDS